MLGSFGLATAVALTVAAAAGLFLQRHVVLSSWASSDTTKQLVLGRHLLQLQSAVQIAQGPPPTPGVSHCLAEEATSLSFLIKSISGRYQQPLLSGYWTGGL